MIEHLQVPAHVLRLWVESLEPLKLRATHARSATPYTAMDIFFLAAIKSLTTAGLSFQALRSVSASVYKAIEQPVVARGADDVLRLYSLGEGQWELGIPTGAAAITLTAPLAELRVQTSAYTGGSRVSGQVEMRLGLTMVSGQDSRRHAPAQERRVSR